MPTTVSPSSALSNSSNSGPNSGSLRSACVFLYSSYNGSRRSMSPSRASTIQKVSRIGDTSRSSTRSRVSKTSPGGSVDASVSGARKMSEGTSSSVSRRTQQRTAVTRPWSWEKKRSRLNSTTWRVQGVAAEGSATGGAVLREYTDQARAVQREIWSFAVFPQNPIRVRFQFWHTPPFHQSLSYRVGPQDMHPSDA
jgi:hypothetical protein